jgi:hypothetical protein
MAISKKKKTVPKLHAKIRSALRLIFLYSQTRRDAMARSNGVCALCKRRHLKKNLQVDHIVAVGSTPGSRNAKADDSWDIFIQRMFCGVDGLQVVCVPCHQKKTHGQ